MRLLLLADTHVPKRARDLPAAGVGAPSTTPTSCVHAGDWVGGRPARPAEERSRRLIGCYGNNDGAGPPRPATARPRGELEGVRLAVVHETGGAKGRESRADRRFPGRPTCWSSATRTSRGTPRRPAGCGCSTPAPPPTAGAADATYLTADIADGRLDDVDLHHAATATGRHVSRPSDAGMRTPGPGPARRRPGSAARPGSCRASTGRYRLGTAAARLPQRQHRRLVAAGALDRDRPERRLARARRR